MARLRWCTSCQTMRPYKLHFGIGTLILIFITFGLWILAILFYRRQCTVCGNTSYARPSEVKYAKTPAWFWCVIIGIFLLYVIYSNLAGDHKKSEDNPKPLASSSLPAPPDRVTQLPSAQESEVNPSEPATSPQTEQPKEDPKPPQPEADFLLIVNQSYPDSGYLRVSGTIKNISNRRIFSPSIVIQLYDQKGEVLLTDDTVWPVGHLLKHMEPGVSAAFESMATIPGGHPLGKLKVFVRKHPFLIKQAD